MVIAVMTAAMLLTGCFGGKFDASGYVRSCLELVTKGETAAYMKATKSTKEEALAVYNAEVKNFVDQLAGQGMPETLNEKYTEFFKKALAATKYEVGQAVETKDKGFEVDVTVEPLNNLLTNMESVMEPIMEDYAKKNPDKLTDEKAVMEVVYSTILDELNKRLATPTYGEKKTIKAKVTLKDKVYTLAEESLEEIGSLLFDVSNESESK